MLGDLSLNDEFEISMDKIQSKSAVPVVKDSIGDKVASPLPKSSQNIRKLQPIAPRYHPDPTFQNLISNQRVGKKKKFLIVSHDMEGGKLTPEKKKLVRSARSKLVWSKRVSQQGSNLGKMSCQNRMDEEPARLYEPSQAWHLGMTSKASKLVSKDDYIKLRNIQAQKETLQLIDLPSYKLLDQIIHAIRLHTQTNLQFRLRPDDQSIAGYGTKALPLSYRPTPRPRNHLVPVTAIKNGLKALEQRQSIRAIAFFEQAFILIDKMLRGDREDVILYLTWAAELFHQSSEPRLSRMFFKHIASMASVIYGPSYPITIWAQCQYLLPEDEIGLIQDTLLRALVDAVDDTLGLDDWFTYEPKVAQLHFTYYLRFDKNKPFQDAIAIYNQLLKITEKSQWSRHLEMNSKSCITLVLIKYQEWELAESYLSDVFDALDEYIINEWQPEDLPPIRISMVLTRIIQLGRVYMSQAKYSQARETLERAIPAATHYLGENDAITTEALSYLSDCLAAEKRYIEAQAISKDIDRRLTPYTLQTVSLEEEAGAVSK